MNWRASGWKGPAEEQTAIKCDSAAHARKFFLNDHVAQAGRARDWMGAILFFLWNFFSLS